MDAERWWRYVRRFWASEAVVFQDPVTGKRDVIITDRANEVRQILVDAGIVATNPARSAGNGP